MMSSIILLVALNTVVPGLAAAGTAEISLTVTGTQPSGKVFGQVFGDAASFKTREHPVVQFAIDPQGGDSVHTTLSLPPGRYAITLFQDTKHTGKFETNMFGVPVVPYGFSNDARGSFGPPGFDAASFIVETAPKALSIELR